MELKRVYLPDHQFREMVNEVRKLVIDVSGGDCRRDGIARILKKHGVYPESAEIKRRVVVFE